MSTMELNCEISNTITSVKTLETLKAEKLIKRHKKLTVIFKPRHFVFLISFFFRSNPNFLSFYAIYSKYT